MTTDIKPGDVLPFLEHMVGKAGRVLMGYFQGELHIKLKDDREGAIDIVTDADRASEDLILEAIHRQFPGHDILTEETPTEKTGSKYLWLVDPLDGTVNFAHSYPVFAVSIALMVDGSLVAGMVHDPLKQETFSAFRNGGAFLNGTPIRVSNADRLEQSVVATGFPYDKAFSTENNLAEFSRVLMKVQGMRRGGSAAMDLAYVASGRLDGFWELKLKPWDMAAGMLLVEEACGRVTDRTGRPTDVYTTSILATNGRIHDLLVEALDEKRPKLA
ncbi:MAG: inositol monophosphatase [Desulfomonile tiedjei]|nr:inositol monophosphatase [Desulfomonile tiedjei]